MTQQTTNPNAIAPCKGGKSEPSSPIQPKNIKNAVPMTSATAISIILHVELENIPAISSPSFIGISDSENKTKVHTHN